MNFFLIEPQVDSSAKQSTSKSTSSSTKKTLSGKTIDKVEPKESEVEKEEYERVPTAHGDD